MVNACSTPSDATAILSTPSKSVHPNLNTTLTSTSVQSNPVALCDCEPPFHRPAPTEIRNIYPEDSSPSLPVRLMHRAGVRGLVSSPPWTLSRATRHLSLGSHTLVPSTKSLADPMLKSALQQQQPGCGPRAEGNAALRKQLFPSSSPTAARDGDISLHLQKPASKTLHRSADRIAVRPTFPSSAQLPGIRSTNTRPLQIPDPDMAVVRRGAGPAFASLYSQSSSFADISGPATSPKAPRNPGAVLSSGEAAVYFDADDFTDDEHLGLDDLDLDQPRALPPSGITPVASGDRDPRPPGSSASCVPWSQSPPSHYRTPNPPSGSGIATAAAVAATKRDSPQDDESVPLPAAKKRVIPKHWQRMKAEADQPTFLVPDEPLPWNTTVGAVESRKRQLKSQHKAAPVEKRPEPNTQAVAGHSKQHHSAAAASVSLSDEQRHVKNLVCTRSASVFFTGPAGTGKSVLMRAIIQELKQKWARDPERLAVTASTGLAACNIGGMTLHSFAGIGLGKEDAQTLVKKIRRNAKAKNRWLRTKTLIIDEISMVDGELFDKLSQIGRILRNNGRPWGGIQLVITGDFFQLPPVPDGEKKRDVTFAFEAAMWNTSIDHTIGLTEVFRQRDPCGNHPTFGERSC